MNKLLLIGVLAVASGCALDPAKRSIEGEKGALLHRIDVPRATLGVIEEKYLVIDVSGGQAAGSWPVSYLSKVPADGWGDEYKTDKIVLRKVNAASYQRQVCSAEEAWKGEAENPTTQIAVNQSFYIGVFEITQRQYEHVTGMKPSHYSPVEGWETLPVESISYDDIRGRHAGAEYPKSTAVDEQSFVGILRQKTGLKTLDLPSSVVWEYCCVAGGSPIDLKGLDSYARFSHYSTIKVANGMPASVGSYKPNGLGLYDMQGNVCEWCLDMVYADDDFDVSHQAFGCLREVRGGHYESLPQLCHPSISYKKNAAYGDAVIGFRICYR